MHKQLLRWRDPISGDELILPEDYATPPRLLLPVNSKEMQEKLAIGELKSLLAAPAKIPYSLEKPL